ncbi:MAG: glycosyltransferase family 1 protein [Caulobacteraceae bacterium]|nr:glycosyltransferase family 1 protein [Caulobacteraceae bacterium]
MATSARGARRLRVALVTSSYNFISDGVALTLNRLVGYLEAQGVEVLVFAPVAKEPAFAHNGAIVPAPSVALPFRPEYRLALGLDGASRRRLAVFDPDIIHIAVPDFLGHQALGLGLARGRPVVASYHTRYESYLKDYGLDFLREGLAGRLRKFYAACHEVYVPSASMAESLMNEGFAGNLELWVRGVDSRRFHPAKRAGLFRARRGIGPDELVVAFVGRLVREKRLDVVAEVLERLAAAGVAHRGLIVGEGPDRRALEKRLPASLFTGFLGGDDLAQAYAASDIFLFPSDTESFGNVTLEAMASGLPTVCADATGSRSLVVQGVTGFLAPPGRSEGFFGHVAALAADGPLRARMGAAARRRSLGFSWDETMAGLLARYEALVAGPRLAAA